MLTFQINNNTLENDFKELVDVFGTEEKAFEEMVLFTKFLVTEQNYSQLIESFSAEFQQNSRFKGMSKEQILSELRKDRKQVGDKI
jgi:hypothetical protein